MQVHPSVYALTVPSIAVETNQLGEARYRQAFLPLTNDLMCNTQIVFELAPVV